MKIVKWYNNSNICIEEVATPIPGPDEILAKVMSCGICGSDVVEWYRLPRAPLVPGHEIGAEVVEVGDKAGQYKPGDRVFIAPKVPCMDCEYCKKGHYPVCTSIPDRLPGGFAEYVLVPRMLVKKGVYPLPEQIGFNQSTFIEPLACVVRAQRLADLRENQTLLVMGCGMSGLLQIQLARQLNCKIAATDISRARLRYAEKAGAEIVIDATGSVLDHLMAAWGKPADVVMICTSAVPAFEQAWQCVDKGGAVVFFTVPAPDKIVTVPLNYFWTRETRLLTSYYCGPTDILQAIDLLARGSIAVDDMITHVLPLSEIAKGYQLVIEGNQSIKVIIQPNRSEKENVNETTGRHYRHG